MLVVLPGMDGTGNLLNDFVDALGHDIATLVVRYPPDRDMNYADLKTLVLKQLPTDRPYVLLAESFSGPIAIAIAASQPPKLSGIVLAASFAKNPRPLMATFRSLLHVLPINHVPTAALSMLLLGKFATPHWRRALGEALAAISSSTLRSRAQAILDVDVTQDLDRISVPLLYLQATEDRVVPPACGRTIVQRAPHARVVEIQAPHFLLQAAAAPTAAAVTAFMATLAND